MKKLIGLFLITAASLVGTAARAQDLGVRANIPFDFVLDGKAYAAGQYTIQNISVGGKALSVRSEEGNRVNIVLAHNCESTEPSRQTKLVFTLVGDSYYLDEVWLQGRTIGRQFPKSKGEMELKLASNQSKPETVILAANIIR